MVGVLLAPSSRPSCDHYQLCSIAPLQPERVDLLHARIAFAIAFAYLATAACIGCIGVAALPDAVLRCRGWIAMGGEMRLLPGFYGALLFLAISAGEAVAACCYTAPPAHVYVPPPHVVIIPHTTYVHPVTPQAHAHIANNSSSAPPTVQARQTPHHHVVQPIIVNTQTTPTSTHCKRQQGGQGCKKDEDQTGWATVRRWLQIGKQ